MKSWIEVQGKLVTSSSAKLGNSHYDLTVVDLDEYAMQGWEVFSIGWGVDGHGEPVMRKALLCREKNYLSGGTVSKTP